MVMRDRFDQFLIEKGLEKGVELLEGNKVLRAEERGEEIEVELARGERIRCDIPRRCRWSGESGRESLSP